MVALLAADCRVTQSSNGVRSNRHATRVETGQQAQREHDNTVAPCRQRRRPGGQSRHLMLVAGAATGLEQTGCASVAAVTSVMSDSGDVAFSRSGHGRLARGNDRVGAWLPIGGTPSSLRPV